MMREAEKVYIYKGQERDREITFLFTVGAFLRVRCTYIYSREEKRTRRAVLSFIPAGATRLETLYVQLELPGKRLSLSLSTRFCTWKVSSCCARMFRLLQMCRLFYIYIHMCI